MIGQSYCFVSVEIFVFPHLSHASYVSTHFYHHYEELQLNYDFPDQKSFLLFNILITEPRKLVDEKDMPCIETEIMRILFKR